MQPDSVAAAARLSMDVPHAIQLALAPVFLLTGIAGLLNVMTGRLSRIIDRGRRLTDLPAGGANIRPGKLLAELQRLESRRRFMGVAITACTLAALLVCMVILLLFLEALLALPGQELVGACFAASTTALVVGLAFFLREVHIATATVRLEMDLEEPKPKPDPPAGDAARR